MARIADLNAQREEEERRRRDEKQRIDEEERLRNQTLAQKALDRWVGKMRQNNPNVAKASTLDNSKPLDSSDDTDKEPNMSSQQHPHNNQGDNGMFAHLISIPITTAGSRATMIMRHKSNRRISVDSSTGKHSSVTNSINSDQGRNFAPRTSVVIGDMTNGGDVDDKSVQSFLSHVSGLLLDDESVLTSGTNLESVLSKLTNGKGMDDDDDDDDDESESGGKGVDFDPPAGGNDVEDDVVRKGGRANMSDSTTPADDDLLKVSLLKVSQFSSSGAISAATSGSDFSADYSDASSSGLIVGFSDRSGDGLIVEFGDRSKRRRNYKDEIPDGGSN